MKHINGVVKKPEGKKEVLSTDEPCIHIARTCESSCPFFEVQKAPAKPSGGWMVVLNCVQNPVTLIVENNDKPNRRQEAK